MAFSEVCNAQLDGIIPPVFAPELAAKRSCAVLGHWPTLSRYLSPDVLLIQEGSQWRLDWHWLGSHYQSYSVLWAVYQAVLASRFPDTDIAVYPLEHAGKQLDSSLCELLGLLVSVFINAVSLHAWLNTLSEGRLVDFISERASQSLAIEYLVDGIEGPLVQGMRQLIVDGAESTLAPAVYGLLQWLATLQADLYADVPMLTGLVKEEGSWRVSHERMTLGGGPCPGESDGDSTCSGFAQFLRCGGSAFWRAQAFSSAKQYNHQPQLLYPLRASGGEQDGRQAWLVFPDVELCSAAAWREGKISSPITSALQGDGRLIHVVAAAMYKERAHGSRGALELLVFTEAPGGLFCGQYIIALPETPLRRWTCTFPGHDGLHAHGDWEVEAAVSSFYHQAVLLSCAVPPSLSVNFTGTVRVDLRADSESANNAAWELPLHICGKAMRPRSSDVKVAMCLQPAYNVEGIEQDAPGLVEQNLRYHELLGFSSLSLYDYDGSFADHGTVRRLLEAGTLRYFPRWPGLISRQVASQCSAENALGVTGSRSMSLVELTLTHCIWGYRGDADFVMLGALDAFVAVGPSAGVDGGGSCWNDSERFQACCDGSLGSRGGFVDDLACSKDGRSFERCCRDFVPEGGGSRSIAEVFSRLPSGPLRHLGAISVGLCEFAAPQPRARNGTLFEHVWRTPTCNSQFYQLVRPEQLVTQSMEWIKVRRGASTFFAPLEWIRMLHLVNTHGGRLRCHRRKNLYVSGRAPCTAPDHGLRWAFPQLLRPDAQLNKS